MTKRRLSRIFIFVAVGIAITVGSLAAAADELPSVPETASAEGAVDEGNPRVRTTLRTFPNQARPGETIQAGVFFEIDPDWHIYWHNSGDGGMATEIDFEASPGRAGPTLWPEPTVYREAGGMIITFGYGDTALMFSEISVQEDASGPVEVTADVDYLVCKVDCIPGEATLTRSVDVTDQPEEVSSRVRRRFEASRATIPRSPEETGVETTVRYSHAPIERSDEFRVEISAIGCRDADSTDCTKLGPPPEEAIDAFVFENVETAELDVTRATEHPDAKSGWFVELTGRTSGDAPPDESRLRGVLRLRTADGDAIPTTVDELFPRTDTDEARALVVGTALDKERPPSTDSDSDSPDEPSLPLPYVLLLAFAGGLLLNLMPCVFPVLAVKVFSFVDVVQKNRESIYLHSAMYTGGIVASLLALAAVVIGLQLVGTRVGWGFQFQDPRFIAGVGAVVVIFALNLFGVFEVSLNPGRLEDVTDAPVSPQRSFGEGVLAVVLATPCSAPFLGTAVGFALTGPPWLIALTFTVLGLGLAAPFVILTIVPGIRDHIPRPGRWMEHFKHLLGFALLGTAIWLTWLIGRMSGTESLVRLLVFFLACGLGAWIFGLVQYRSRRARWTGLVAAAVLIAGTAGFVLEFEKTPEKTKQTTGSDTPIAWQEWSEDRVQSELRDGRPVFVDFTADWCITCKTNEATVLETDEVVDTIDEHDVAMLKADWTHRDDNIRSRLEDFGKAGVPLYLVYSPEEPRDPKVLPEVLTREMVTSAIEESAP